MKFYILNPYTNKLVNVEPLLYLLNYFGSARDLGDYVDTAIRDLVVAYQMIPDEDRIAMSGEISFLFDIRDMFDDIDVK